MVQGSGYVISRTKDAVEMRIDANKFFQKSVSIYFPLCKDSIGASVIIPFCSFDSSFRPS